MVADPFKSEDAQLVGGHLQVTVPHGVPVTAWRFVPLAAKAARDYDLVVDEVQVRAG